MHATGMLSPHAVKFKLTVLDNIGFLTNFCSDLFYEPWIFSHVSLVCYEQI
jgi:hypothetical protein